ncbi:Chaperone J-domain containing protein [Gracilaria domingensis]|nr:Chaperone J-domain containing protein [Gracilaria domingensis]
MCGAADRDRAHADPYAVLGVSRSASTQQVRRAYKALCLRWHPDKHPAGAARRAAERQFKAISVAYAAVAERQPLRRTSPAAPREPASAGSSRAFARGADRRRRRLSQRVAKHVVPLRLAPRGPDSAAHAHAGRVCGRLRQAAPAGRRRRHQRQRQAAARGGQAGLPPGRPHPLPQGAQRRRRRGVHAHAERGAAVEARQDPRRRRAHHAAHRAGGRAHGRPHLRVHAARHALAARAAGHHAGRHARGAGVRATVPRRPARVWRRGVREAGAVADAPLLVRVQRARVPEARRGRRAAEEGVQLLREGGAGAVGRERGRRGRGVRGGAQQGGRGGRRVRAARGARGVQGRARRARAAAAAAHDAGQELVQAGGRVPLSGFVCLL